MMYFRKEKLYRQSLLAVKITPDMNFNSQKDHEDEVFL